MKSRAGDIDSFTSIAANPYMKMVHDSWSDGFTIVYYKIHHGHSKKTLSNCAVSYSEPQYLKLLTNLKTAICCVMYLVFRFFISSHLRKYRY